MMSLKKYKMKSWLLIAAVFVSLCAVMGLMTLTVPEAEAAGSGPLKVGSNYYANWDDAVAAAKKTSGGTIVVTGNYTFPSSSKTYYIYNDITLLIPYSTSSTSVNSSSAKHPYANEALVKDVATDPGNPYKNVSMTVTVPEGVTVYVYGKLIVGGQIGANTGVGTLWSGGTIGAHANLQVDGTINLRNSAKMAVTGYRCKRGDLRTDGRGVPQRTPHGGLGRFS